MKYYQMERLVELGYKMTINRGMSDLWFIKYSNGSGYQYQIGDYLAPVRTELISIIRPDNAYLKDTYPTQ